MKAMRLVSPSEPLVLQDVDVPDPGSDEVLVRVAGCGVCHTDVGFWKDGVPTRGPLPITLGHEISGVVVEAGKAHRDLVGREVIVPAVIPCGQCDLCARGRGNACRGQLMPGNDMDGGFAELVRVPGRFLCPAEDRGDLELAELSVVADAVTTPYQAAVRSGLREGDVAIVVGIGGVGTHCVQIAHAFGAQVVAIDVNARHLEAVSDHGADITIDSSVADFREVRTRIRDAVAGWKALQHGWKIFECSGSAAGQATAYGLVNHASVLMLVGFTLERVEVRLSNLMVFDATVQGTWGCRPELYPEALALVADGRIALRPFIESHPLSRGPEILQDVADHRLDRRAILVPDPVHQERPQ